MQNTHKLFPKHPLQALLSLGLAISLSIPVQASPLSDEIDTLLSKDLFAHQTEIQTKAAGLLPAERQQLYQRYQKEALTGSLLNLLPIFGYGSYRQGDLVGGISLSVLDGLSYGLLATALLQRPTFDGGYNGIALIGFSLVSFALGRVIGFTSPLVHGGYYNTTLQQSLNPGTAPLSLSPESLNSYPLLAFEHSF